MYTKIPDSPELDELNLLDDEDHVTPGRTGPAVFGERSADTPAVYEGPQRRAQHRRQGSDRRAQIRFEAGGGDRRSGFDRRKGIWQASYDI